IPLIALLTNLSGILRVNGPFAGVPLCKSLSYFLKMSYLSPVTTAFSQFTISIFSPSKAFLATKVPSLPSMRLFASIIILAYYSDIFAIGLLFAQIQQRNYLRSGFLQFVFCLL